jgi:shikimate kinase
MGFKHVGKSIIGRKLAVKLNKPFLDLDQHIEFLFSKRFHQRYSCRKIAQIYGEPFFRDLENKALRDIIDSKPAIISLGGGAPLYENNQNLLKSHVLIHLIAPKEIVFERIMRKGLPSFFPSEADPWQYFNELWGGREKIYQKLANITINNDGSLDLTIEQIINQITKIGQP